MDAVGPHPHPPKTFSGDSWEHTAEYPLWGLFSLKDSSLAQGQMPYRDWPTSNEWSICGFKGPAWCLLWDYWQGPSSFRAPHGISEDEPHPTFPLCPVLLPSPPHSCQRAFLNDLALRKSWVSFLGNCPKHLNLLVLLEPPQVPASFWPTCQLRIWNTYTCLPASLGKN